MQYSNTKLYVLITRLHNSYIDVFVFVSDKQVMQDTRLMKVPQPDLDQGTDRNEQFETSATTTLHTAGALVLQTDSQTDSTHHIFNTIH